jgi:hypothetical protein
MLNFEHRILLGFERRTSSFLVWLRLLFWFLESSFIDAEGPFRLLAVAITASSRYPQSAVVHRENDIGINHTASGHR